MNLHSLHARGRGIPLTETQQLDASNLLTDLKLPRSIQGYFILNLNSAPQSEIYQVFSNSGQAKSHSEVSMKDMEILENRQSYQRLFDKDIEEKN